MVVALGWEPSPTACFVQLEVLDKKALAFGGGFLFL